MFSFLLLFERESSVLGESDHYTDQTKAERRAGINNKISRKRL